MKTLLKISLWLLCALAIYLIGGIILSDYIFPPEKPDLTNYFAPGDRFISNSEGFDQTVLSTSDGWIHLMLEVRPSAPGPPVHIHENMDEKFYVKSGVLSILVNGEKKVLGPGQSFTVSRGAAHKPFNETTGTVVAVSDEDTKTVPDEFAYFLSQIYPLVDKYGGEPDPLQVLLQFSVYGDEMDAYIADGPPVAVQKLMRTFIRPTARLLGYKYYYPEYKPQH